MAQARTLFAAAGLAALALVACHRNPPPLQPLPLTEAGPSPLATAPPPDALPVAKPVKVRYLADSRDDYAWPERAWAVSDVFYDSPPDWAFDWSGVEPWVWRTDDGYWRFVEWVPGGTRVYYFAPGWNEPYFISDPDYGYAYDRGALVVVYDRSGRPLDPADVRTRADYAGRYLTRAGLLYRAAQRADRVPISRDDWMSRRGGVEAERARWADAGAGDPGLVAARATARAHWAEERARRASHVADVERRLGDPAAADRAQRRAAQARALAQAGPHGPFGGPPRMAAVGGERAGFLGLRNRDRQGHPATAQVRSTPEDTSHDRTPHGAARNEIPGPAPQSRRHPDAAPPPQAVARGADRGGRDAAFRDRQARREAAASHRAAPAAPAAHAERRGRGAEGFHGRAAHAGPRAQPPPPAVAQAPAAPRPPAPAQPSQPRGGDRGQRSDHGHAVGHGQDGGRPPGHGGKHDH